MRLLKLLEDNLSVSEASQSKPYVFETDQFKYRKSLYIYSPGEFRIIKFHVNISRGVLKRNLGNHSRIRIR